MEIRYFCNSPTVDEWIGYIRKCEFRFPLSFIERTQINSVDHYYLGNRIINTGIVLNQWETVIEKGIVTASRFDTFDGRKLSRTLHDLSRLRNQAVKHFADFTADFKEALEVDGDLLLNKNELEAVRQTERGLFHKLRPFEQAGARLSRNAHFALRVEDTEKQIRILSGRVQISGRSGMVQRGEPMMLAGLLILIPAICGLACHEKPEQVANDVLYSMIDCLLPFPASSFIDPSGRRNRDLQSGDA